MKRLLEILRPQIGWPMFLLVLTAGICFPAAIYVGRWVDDSFVLVGLGVAGGIVGSWLAGRRLSDRLTWSLGLMLGGIAAFIAVGQTLPSPLYLFQIYGSLEMPAAEPGFTNALIRTIELLVTAAWFYGREFALRSLAFAAQVARWGQIVLAGGTSRDNDIFLLWTGWLSWGVAFNTVAAFTRRRHPGLALAPAGLAVTTVVAGGRGGDAWLLMFLGLGAILLAYGAYQQWERHWIRDQIDYSPDIRLDVVLAGTFLASMIVTLAFSVGWGLPWAVNVLRRPLAEPTQQMSTTLDRLFSGVRRPPAAGTGWNRTDFSALPLSRVLAGPPELRDEPVLKITASVAEGIDVPRLYWRGMTYDRYTGRGWANSANERERRPPQPDLVAHLGGEITQRITLLNGAGPVRYAAARPLRVDVGATWITRGNGDLVGWYADAREYTVVSRPTVASIEELRSTAPDDLGRVTDRYLQLPPELPERVRQRAQLIVVDATTRYDKAAAIEAAMRDITYSLEVGAPPPDRDVVDYFLFDMDAGYCDYFATTMTVLARAVGVPARLAAGYATGTYDPERGAYVVTGLDAHAWVEVYFPGIGWVPFEPTPAREVIERSPAPTPMPDQRSEQQVDAGVDPRRLVQPGLLLIGLAGVGGLGLWAIQRTRAGESTPEDEVRAAYDAVWRRAGWFGWDSGAVGKPATPARGGRPATPASQTPWERIEALQHVLAERSFEVALGGRQWTWRGADVVEDLRRLGILFTKAQYSQQGVTLEEAQTAHAAWCRLRWRLMLLWKG